MCSVETCDLRGWVQASGIWGPAGPPEAVLEWKSGNISKIKLAASHTLGWHLLCYLYSTHPSLLHLAWAFPWTASLSYLPHSCRYGSMFPQGPTITGQFFSPSLVSTVGHAESPSIFPFGYLGHEVKHLFEFFGFILTVGCC